MQVAIIDYGVGNLRSVEKAFQASGIEASVTSSEKELLAAEKLVLPGVGAFGACMRELKARGFDQLVKERVERGAPLLGVCVGMQMLFEESEEFGPSEGLGLLRGRVKRFDPGLRVPHIGWNSISVSRRDPIFENIEDHSFFYFVHSYYCDPADSSAVLGKTEYGVAYASIVGKAKVYGVQFHPEKSQASGLRLLKNFAEKVDAG
jgi:imidazole glycerol-phosphate synthase subunit HisH